ncbi:MAG: TolC family protein [Candidatus Anammoximicrobium sp.]|nr:TolC family protein [Candidatus Anammoximicrobium sp.]
MITLGLRPFVPVLMVLALLLATARFAPAQDLPRLLQPGQSTIQVRDPAQLLRLPPPDVPPPATVTHPEVGLPERRLTLDEAIRIALANSQVVRVLAGVSAVSSGRTVFDAAIVNNRVDDALSRFDPRLQVNNGFQRTETAGAGFDPLDPSRALITGNRTDGYNFQMDLSKTTPSGGTASLGVSATPLRRHPERDPQTLQNIHPLNPESRSSVDLSYTQPLWQGGGWSVNRVPIVLARIDSERSYFQFKDGVQEMVRGVIEAYWSLVAARVERWARERQVEQAQFVLDLSQGRFELGIRDIGDVAQARVSLANFRSALLTAQNATLEREAALRNILGLPPMDRDRVVPVTPLAGQRTEFQWKTLLGLAEEQRPDLIELKLVLEADQQQLLQVRNAMSPQLDAVALYRWNGLEGEMPNGDRLRSRSGQFTDWALGVNFSVPIGLRQGRAALRSQELVIARDRANLQQGLHAVTHELAQCLRSLDRAWEQYQLAQETREAAWSNLNLQLENFRVGRSRAGETPFVNVRLAITDWGNAISSEAQYLTLYNIELANLDRQTGTILETHGIRFYEERFCTLGPLGELGRGRLFPASLEPIENVPRYPSSDRPAEESFHLENPVESLNSTRTSSAKDSPPRDLRP